MNRKRKRHLSANVLVASLRCILESVMATIEASLEAKKPHTSESIQSRAVTILSGE
jgi:hypothetical protein